MKCLSELTKCLTPTQFPQTFLTNPLKLRLDIYEIHRNIDTVV